jgi:hypothetical protein
MTSIYHTPIAFRAALASSVVNSPLGELDQAIGNIRGLGFKTYTTVAAYTTSSSSWTSIDPTNMSHAINTQGGNVLVLFSGSFLHSVIPSNMRLDVDVDGSRIGSTADGIARISWPVANLEIYAGILNVVTGLSAGNHIFTMQWRTNTATLTLTASDAQFSVLELL